LVKTIRSGALSGDVLSTPSSLHFHDIVVGGPGSSLLHRVIGHPGLMVLPSLHLDLQPVWRLLGVIRQEEVVRGVGLCRVFLRPRPAGRFEKVITSARCTRVRPAKTSVRSRPRLISRATAWRLVLRSRAASACEIQSSGFKVE